MKLKCYRKPSGLIMLQVSDAKFTKRFYYSTGEYCADPKEWDPKNGFTKDASALNDRLMAIMKKANDYVLMNRQNFSREGLRSALDGTSPKEVIDDRRTLLTEYKDYLTVIKGTVDPESHRNYEKSMETFEEFLKAKKLVFILPDGFTFRHYQMYLVYLMETMGYAPNTVAKKTKHFKMFVNYLGKLKLQLGMDPDEITFKEYSGVKISLTDQELKTIEGLSLVGLISDARDMFVLQCLTGLRISDLFRLDRNIRNGKIYLETQKVEGNTVEIPIIPRVRRIIDKHNGKLPEMAEQTYREFIKEIYKKVNPEGTIEVRVGNKFETKFIWQEISSHDAVRTFITLSAEKGMPIDYIAKIVGKTVKVLLKNYLVTTQKSAEESMLRAWNDSDEISMRIAQ